MGLFWPNYPADVQDGDEPTFSPTKNQNSLLGAERGTQSTRRLETDASSNLYVRVAADDAALPASVSVLAGGAVTAVASTILTTVLTYTPGAASKVTRISVSGTNYAKVQIFLSAALIETKRMGPDRNIEFNWASPLAVGSGVPLDVKVTHYVTGETNDFEASVYGV